MVSLANNAGHSGGYFGFSDDRPTINSMGSDDELIVDHIELVSGHEMVHKPMRTTWAIWLAKILYVLLGVSAYVVPIVCSNCTCGEDPISLTLYIHGGMWFILLLLDRFLHQRHDKSRLQGYLEFYRKTRNIRRLPFMINSCANAIMVVMIKVLDSHCNPDTGRCLFLNKTRYIQILVSIECAVALVVLFVYFAWTVKFNSKKALPDVHQEELMTSFVNTATDLGYRNGNEIDQVMEKQADMIRYLRQHSENLARRNLSLTEEVNRLKGVRRDGSINGHF
ncbi:transmembrane protein 192-like [Aplysia californica]|uniref:Transmembrane protein 192 n=1 Tax=Aplysia californica TaxID=6500 RepID=A0ABM1ACR6_APLCA|nr:transmembrane protein 192-like [Aplysia californica]